MRKLKLNSNEMTNSWMRRNGNRTMIGPKKMESAMM